MVLFGMRDDIILIKFVTEYVSINSVHEAIMGYMNGTDWKRDETNLTINGYSFFSNSCNL